MHDDFLAPLSSDPRMEPGMEPGPGTNADQQHSSQARSPADADDGLATAEELRLFRERYTRMAAMADIVEAGDETLCDEAPRAVGRFEIVKELGRGSYGTVYAAYDSSMSRNVAIKIAHPGTYSSEKLKGRFLKEAHAAARMGHPNVVTVHEYGEEEGSLYIVYQLCIGPTLADWLAEQPDRVQPRIAAEIVRQLAMGLDHAHAHGIVHRDIKPSNIILEHNSRSDGRGASDAGATGTSYRTGRLGFTPRITDFGLAHDRLGSEASLSDSLLGTIDFMSPEQVQNGSLARFPTSDIYSLGVILYRMLTGQLPSRGESVMEILYQICSVEPPSPTYLNPNVSADLAAICMKCLAKNAKERYRNCQELIKDIENWQNCRPVLARPARFHEKMVRSVKRAPVVCSLAAAVVIISSISVLLVAGLAIQLGRKNQELAMLLRLERLSRETAVRSERNKDLAMRDARRLAYTSEQAERRARDQAYDVQLHFAYQDFSKGQTLAASRTLESMAETLFSDQYLPRFDYLVLASMLKQGTQRLNSHTDAANTVAHIPGTNLVVTGGGDGKLLFHNASNGALEHVFATPHGAAAISIAVSPDARRIAIGCCMDYSVYKLNLVRVHELNVGSAAESWIGRLTHEFFATATCQSICFSPDGRRLAYAQRYGYPIVFDFETESVIQINCSSRHRLLSFSPDGGRLLVASKDKSAKIFDVVSGEEQAKIDCDDTPEVALWSSDGRWIACCSYNHSDIEIFDGTTPHRLIGRAKQSRGSIKAVAFAAGGRQLIGGTKAGGIVCWDLEQLRNSASLTPTLDVVPHAGLIMNMQVAGTAVVSTDDVGQVLSTPLPIPAATGSDLVPAAMCTVHGTAGKYLAGYPDGSLKIVDARGRILEVLLPANGQPITEVHSSASGIAVGWHNGRVAFQKPCAAWSACNYELPRDSLQELDILDLQLSPDGKHLAACGADAWIRVWETDSPDKPQWDYQFTSNARQLCIIDNHVVCGGMFEEIAIFEIATGKMTGSLTSTSSTTCLMLDTHRNVLVSAHQDGRLRFHRTSDWAGIGTALNTIDEVRSLCMSPDNTCYLVGTAHGNLDVWNADQLRIVGTLASYPDHRPVDLVEVIEPSLVVTLSFSNPRSGLQVADNGVPDAPAFASR